MMSLPVSMKLASIGPAKRIRLIFPQKRSVYRKLDVNEENKDIEEEEVLTISTIKTKKQRHPKKKPATIHSQIKEPESKKK